MIEDLQPYPEYQASGLAWLGNIPINWTTSRTKTRFRLRVDKSGRDHGKELLSIYTHIGVRPRKDLEQKGNRATTTDDYWVVRKGDIIVNKLLAWMGAVGASHFDGVTSPAYDILRPLVPLESDYYHHLFRTRLYLELFKARSRGIMDMRLRLYFDELGQIPILSPPLDDQVAIVRFLEHANGTIERAIWAKRKLIALLNEQKQAIIHRAVTRGLDPTVKLKPSGILWLGDVPEHWEVMRLGHVISLLTGYPFSSAGFSTNEGDTRLLRGINVTPTGIRWNNVVRWKQEVADGLDDFALQVGDIVLGLDRPIVATGIRASAINQSDTPSMLLQRVARIRTTCRIDRHFLLLLLRGRIFADYMAPIFTGISVPHLSPEQIKLFKVMLPSIKEQKGIVTFISRETSTLDTVISRTEREIELLREYRTTLTAEVVAGKLDVREAVKRLPAAVDEPLPAEDLPDDLAAEEDLEEAAA